jgi:hypothetical protein
MDYPEHDKLKSVQTDSQIIGNFLQWLEEKHWVICERSQERRGWIDPAWMPVDRTIERMLAEYLEIDLVRLETEKRAILAGA